jgi:hypothetical protein
MRFKLSNTLPSLLELLLTIYLLSLSDIVTIGAETGFLDYLLAGVVLITSMLTFSLSMFLARATLLVERSFLFFAGRASTFSKLSDSLFSVYSIERERLRLLALEACLVLTIFTGYL